jgi:hypothetical protein
VTLLETPPLRPSELSWFTTLQGFPSFVVTVVVVLVSAANVTGALTDIAAANPTMMQFFMVLAFHKTRPRRWGGAVYLD